MNHNYQKHEILHACVNLLKTYKNILDLIDVRIKRMSPPRKSLFGKLVYPEGFMELYKERGVLISLVNDLELVKHVAEHTESDFFPLLDKEILILRGYLEYVDRGEIENPNRSSSESS